MKSNQYLRQKYRAEKLQKTTAVASESASEKVKGTVKGTTSKSNNHPPPTDILTDEYKSLICSQSYLGKKGYTIPKSILLTADEAILRKELMVRPIVAGVNYGPEDPPFPVFRENANKIYVPRFYGITRYGEPSRYEIEEGDNIDVEFVKTLRDYQEEIVDIYVRHVDKGTYGSLMNPPLLETTEKEQIVPLKGGFAREPGFPCGGAILEVNCGAGKTVMALKIISILKKKTLIIVHKEFLMNQWIERIAEFLPTAKVGKIQGPVFDCAGKDIVIGMVQTLYDKEYSADTFSCFGLTIIDEVHRIGSEQFSRTLFKTICPCMLGISATVDRKDQLTRILYMFIGEKIYSKKREGEDAVCVRAIEYISTDSEFNETELDFRGNPKYSTMITKLCEFGPRSDFIVRVLTDLVKEEPDNQIMILCHNRSLLTYLSQSIIHKNIATVGFYVGGMKQKALQQTEEKQIVLATYAMAAEALDIKTLSTLVMVTPKTDITQSVGRILRVKHENPIIVDIVDSHSVFKNQWSKRRVFFKKANYRIRKIDSNAYKGMSIDWAEDRTWQRVYEPKTTIQKPETGPVNPSEYLVEEEEEDDADSKNNLLDKRCLINVDAL